MKILPQYSKAKRILVFNPSFIGDAVLSTPLITTLHKLLPEAEIDFCVRPESAPLFPPETTVIFDKRRQYKGVSGMLKFAHLLRDKNYDMALCLHKSLRSTLLMKLSKIPVAVGFKEASMDFFYTHTVRRDMALHEVERNLALLSAITEDFTLAEAKSLGGKPFTYLDEAYFNELRGTIKRPVIGLNPGSVWATKQWPGLYYGRLGHMLHNAGFDVAVFGGPGDKVATEEVKGYLTKNNVPFYDFANKIPFSQIPAAIKNMEVLVTNDSAPLHIAVSQKVPVVAIFGATVRELGFYPYDDKSIICENNLLECRPCGLHGKNHCPQKHFKCMLEVTPESVFEAVLRLVNQP